MEPRLSGLESFKTERSELLSRQLGLELVPRHGLKDQMVIMFTLLSSPHDGCRPLQAPPTPVTDN